MKKQLLTTSAVALTLVGWAAYQHFAADRVGGLLSFSASPEAGLQDKYANHPGFLTNDELKLRLVPIHNTAVSIVDKSGLSIAPVSSDLSASHPLARSSIREILIDAKMKHNDPETLKLIDTLVGHPACQSLAEAHAKRLLFLVGGINRLYAASARERVASILARNRVDGGDLLAVLRTHNYLAGSDDPIAHFSYIVPGKSKDDTKPTTGSHVAVGKARPSVIFSRATGWQQSNGLLRTYAIRGNNGLSVDVDVNFHKDLGDDSVIVERVASLLAVQPPALIRFLKGIRVSNFNDVSAVTTGDGIIDFSPAGLLAPTAAVTLLHEMAHVAWVVQGSKTTGLHNWSEAARLDGMLPSRYAETHPLEHIAEVSLVWARAQENDLVAKEYRALFHYQIELFEKMIATPKRPGIG